MCRPVSGSLDFDAAKLCEHAWELLHSKGLAQFAELLENKHVKDLHCFGDPINDIDLSLKKQTFDVEGSTHSSTCLHDEEGNITREVKTQIIAGCLAP